MTEPTHPQQPEQAALLKHSGWLGIQVIPPVATAAAVSDSALVSGTEEAKASLRDTAKWMVGGVVASAAGIAAGSSLTKLGSLDLADPNHRLIWAIAGAVVGFCGLTIIFYHAASVLTITALTFRSVAAAETKETWFDQWRHGVPKRIATAILEAYSASIPGDEKTLTAVQKILDDRSTARREEANAFVRMVKPYMSYLSVDYRFRKLVRSLFFATPLLVAGFGLYAWAANPAEPQPAKPAFTLSFSRN